MPKETRPGGATGAISRRGSERPGSIRTLRGLGVLDQPDARVRLQLHAQPLDLPADPSGGVGLGLDLVPDRLHLRLCLLLSQVPELLAAELEGLQVLFVEPNELLEPLAPRIVI